MALVKVWWSTVGYGVTIDLDEFHLKRNTEAGNDG